ncbi:allantoate permease, putative [Cordyceps militaris CM01]|uniref:Allantoate permease, putative n=1 Tax=Cordyceps militaris (strain CM01) TaxID=983644 RepID=G3JD49_CORMM|nr:allantoate permease, putative [Cordyceps militaris CM01]EGX93375.1 allantoate permease, putative [Cordyceps militaris CM01]
MIGVMMWAKLVQRWPQHAGKFISGAVLSWSTIILLTPLCFNFAGIATARFFLGLVESIIGPVFVIVTSNWWTRQEQASRTAFWLSGTPVGNFIGGLLTYGLGKVHGSIATWKIFFLFFGSFSLLFALVVVVLMPDNQTNARWLNQRQKQIAMERVRANQTVTADDKWKWNQFREALRDPQTLLFFVTAM